LQGRCKLTTIEQSIDSLWHLFDAYRAEGNTADIVPVLAVLIYLRWVDFQDAENAAIAEFDEVEYFLALSGEYRWNEWIHKEAEELSFFLSNKVSQELSSLSNQRNNSLATYLHYCSPILADSGKVDPVILKNIVEWISGFSIEKEHDRTMLLNNFDVVIDRSRGKKGGESRTPSSIISLMVNLATPGWHDKIYDPCFGTGGFFTESIKHIESHVGENFQGSKAPAHFYGEDINQDSFMIGLTRSILAGIDSQHLHLELGNSLHRTSDDNSNNNKYNIVFANPPWGQRRETLGLFHFPFPGTDSTGLFLQQAISQVMDGGKVVIVVPDGFLFRKGQDQRLREWLLKNHELETIISLPAGAFNPFTSIQTSVLVIRKGSKTREIRMIDSKSYFQTGKRSNESTIEIEPLLRLLSAEVVEDEDYWDVDFQELAIVDWDLSVKRRTMRDIYAKFESMSNEISVGPLKNYAEIRVGTSVRSQDLNDSPTDEDSMSYIRIQDLVENKVTRGSSWLSHSAQNKIQTEKRILTGDILLSKSGTIGKTGIVGQQANGAVLSSGLFAIRVLEGMVTPAYLLAYLESSDCKAWLDANSRGSSVRHLTKKAIEELPIPVPSIQVQNRIVSDFGEFGLDAIENLAGHQTGGVGVSILNHLESMVEYDPMNTLSSFINPSSDESIFESFSDLLTVVEADAPSAGGKSDRFRDLVKIMTGVFQDFERLQNIPRGATFYSQLLQIQNDFSQIRKMGRGSSSSEVMLLKYSTLLEQAIKKAIEELLEDIDLKIESDFDEVISGRSNTLRIKFHNQSPLPLFDIVFSTLPDWGSGEVGFLAEKESKEALITVEAPEKGDKLSIRIHWSGTTFDKNNISGESELVYRINYPSTISPALKDELKRGGSPYVTGDPVIPARSDVFFGRDELLRQISRQVKKSGNVILLEGNRRSGKSSILRHLEGEKEIPGWLCVYCSLQDATGSDKGVGVPTAKVFRTMAKRIAIGYQKLGYDTPLPNGSTIKSTEKIGIAKACREGIGEDSSFEDFQEYLELMLELLSEKNLSLLLMMDEFDKLQEGIDNGITSPQVPENIRYLVHSSPRFSVILTGSRRLKKLREEYWSALFGLGTRFGVTVLPEEAATKLIVEPTKDIFVYTNEAINYSKLITARQPFLLQCLCSRIFDIGVNLKTSSINLDIVKQAGKILIEDNEHFASLWKYAGSELKRYILILLHSKDDKTSLLGLEEIQELMLVDGFEISIDNLKEALDFLLELELVNLETDDLNNGFYSLSIPLMGQWIHKQQDLSVVLQKARLETEDNND
jgi:type I restriction enzyme M protein